MIFDNDTDEDGTCHGDEGNGSTRYLYAANDNYNVMALTDANGAAVEKVKYDPYGQPTCTRVSDSDVTTESHFGNPYLFQGQRYDSETGLYYFKNRYYSPTLGRFLQRDPAGYIDGSSLYEVLRSNSGAFLDAWGLGAYCGPKVDQVLINAVMRIQVRSHTLRSGDKAHGMGFGSLGKMAAVWISS